MAELVLTSPEGPREMGKLLPALQDQIQQVADLTSCTNAGFLGWFSPLRRNFHPFEFLANFGASCSFCWIFHTLVPEVFIYLFVCVTNPLSQCTGF